VLRCERSPQHAQGRAAEPRRAEKDGAAPPSLPAMLFSYGENSSNLRASRLYSDDGVSTSMLKSELRKKVPHLPHLPACSSPMERSAVTHAPGTCAHMRVVTTARSEGRAAEPTGKPQEKVPHLPRLQACSSPMERATVTHAPRACSDASDRLSMLKSEPLSLGELRRKVPHLPR